MLIKKYLNWIPNDVDVNVGGTNDDINEAIEQLVLAMALRY